MKLDKLEAQAVELIARTAPWLAPVPTAYLVGRATVLHLHWPVWVALVAALAVELLGLAITATALELREYNRSRRKGDPSAPLTLTAALVAAYLLTALTLTVALDTLPGLATYAPAVFPFLSLAGTVTLAIRADHRRRLDEIAAAKAQARAERAQARAERAQARAERAEHRTEPPAPPPEQAGTRARARAVLAEFPNITGAELGRKLAVSDRMGRKLRAELLPELSAVSGNGHKDN